MSFRTLLAPIFSRADSNDIDAAVALCTEMQANVVVPVLEVVPPPPAGSDVTVAAGWLDVREQDLSNLLSRREALQAHLNRAGVNFELDACYADAGHIDTLIGQRGRYADLTILGPNLIASGWWARRVFQGALFGSGHPVLLVPERSKPTLRPKVVVIAWNAKVEAVRAVREALDMLTCAEEVRVIMVDPRSGPGQHGEEPGADLAAYLARHGLNVTVDRLEGGNRPTGDVIREHAIKCGADLLVMGGYGHSRLREWIFGGVTAYMLESPPVPVFMAR